MGRIFVQEIFRWQRESAGIAGLLRRVRGGAICFPQRFGGSLNLNVHYHVAVPVSSLSNGELRLLVRWGPARPICPGCAMPLPAEAVPPGGDGRLACRCGQSIATFPVPEWLRQVVPTALQLFGAARDGAPDGLVVMESSTATKPVLFGCPRCGAGLDIAPESPRILTCKYCDTDLYLPDALWHALHPIKKRTPFWVAFDE